MITTYLIGLAAITAVLIATWVLQLKTRNAGHVDITWSFSLGIAAVVYALLLTEGLEVLDAPMVHASPAAQLRRRRRSRMLMNSTRPSGTAQPTRQHHAAGAGVVPNVENFSD